jgi:DNA invertase Pin-like site-specific DNA recombinase
MSKRCAVYIRVSSEEQNSQMQRDELLEYAKSRGWTVTQVYEDKRTGTNDKRSELQKMLLDVRARRADILLCWKLDRVFRSFTDMVNTLQLLVDLGVEFVSLKDAGVDMTTASGKLLTHILAAFAEFEASIIRMRVRSGVQAKIRRTGKWGRGKSRDDSKIAALKAKGLSNRAVARELGISEGTVRRSLAGASNTIKKATP